MNRFDQPALQRLAVVLGLLLWHLNAMAEPRNPETGLKEVLRKAQGVMRQLNEDKTRLETEKAALQTEKTALEQQVRQLTATLGKLETLPDALARCQADAGILHGALGQSRSQEAALKRQQQALTEHTRQVESDNQWLVAAVREREQWIERCGENNRHLVQGSEALAEKYRQQSLWKRLAELEPLTGIGAIQTENAAEAYRYQMHQLKVTPFTGAVQP